MSKNGADNTQKEMAEEDKTIPNISKFEAFLEALRKLEDEHDVHVGIPSTGAYILDNARPKAPVMQFGFDEAEDCYRVLDAKGKPRGIAELYEEIGQLAFERWYHHWSVKRDKKKVQETAQKVLKVCKIACHALGIDLPGRVPKG